jgi:hypothetical protein
MDYSDEQLRQRFRFGRETIDYLANELRGSLERPTAKMLSNFMLQHLFFCYRKVWFSISLGLNRAKDLLNFGHIDTGSTLLSFALWENRLLITG